MQKRIGEYLLEQGLITEMQQAEILRFSQKTGIRFGDAGIQLGFITRDQLIDLFGPNYRIDFFSLEPRYFPQITRDLFDPDLMLRFGALPLGFKTEFKLFRSRKMLNVGLLNPSRTDTLPGLEHAANSKLGPGRIQGIKPFLVLADQFIAVMGSVYGLSEDKLRALDPSKLDPTLVMFLERPDGRGSS
jgi:hypothetical protein